jgi:hypothetical protein
VHPPPARPSVEQYVLSEQSEQRIDDARPIADCVALELHALSFSIREEPVTPP